jgi:hypothetical protein
VQITLADFCEIISRLQKSNAEKALLVLWHFDSEVPDKAMTSGQLVKIMVDHHVGTPNSTVMAKQIRATKLANESKDGFWLKPGSRKIIHGWLPAGIHGMQPAIDHSTGYLSNAIWDGTRRYIESVCKQLNGCFRSAYYDAALVMMRRLFETLIIEAYEHLNRKSEIEISGGNYHMFAGLVERATGKNAHAGLNIGRNTKNALDAVKALGDRSAHDRRFMACVSDLVKIQIDVRSGAQDLIEIANLKKA